MWAYLENLSKKSRLCHFKDDGETTMPKSYKRTVTVRWVNGLIGLLTRLGIAPKNQYILQVQGRKSGRLYTTPVILVEENNQRWLVAPYGEVQWVKNARAIGQVTLKRKGKDEVVNIAEIAPLERGAILKKYLKLAPITQAYFKAHIDDPPELFAAEGQNHPVFLVQLG
jgi:deazaflavin-dependent oxidoreductase (nitroreductase family)